MIIRFIIYGLLGWNIEIFWTGIGSLTKGDINLTGHTSVWMFFIYGSAAFLFEPVHRLIRDCNFFVRGLVWTELIFAVELACGLLLRIFGIEAWHYDCKTAILGVIRLDYAPAWFAVGLIFEKVHDLLISYNIGIRK